MGFVVAVAGSVATKTFFIVTYNHWPIESALWRALDDVLLVVFVFGIPWLTAWWWGAYLRYACSNPGRRYEPIGDDEVDWPTYVRRLPLRERLLIRCDALPMEMFVVSILGNVVICLVLFACGVF